MKNLIWDAQTVSKFLEKRKKKRSGDLLVSFQWQQFPLYRFEENS